MIPKLSTPKPFPIPGYKPLQDAQLIIRLEGNRNYTLVHLENKLQPLMLSKTLKYFEDQLPDFIRISKSTIINPMYVQQVICQNAKATYLQLPNGIRVLISRRRLTTTLIRLAP